MHPDYFRQEWQRLNRLYLAQIFGVDHKNGTVDVVLLDGYGSKKERLEIPHLGFSIQGAKDADGKRLDAFKSAWIRFMPQIGDHVYVAFGPHNEPRIVSMATYAGNTKGQYQEAVEQKARAPSKFPRGDFKELRPGEWDMRSSGGAYIYGSKEGSLLLSAGPTTQIRLNRPSNEVRAESGLWAIASTGSFIRLGDVKRTLVGAFAESDRSILDPLGTKEWRVHVETPARALADPVLPLFDEWAGSVRSSLGIPELSSVDEVTPLRWRRRIYATGSTSALPLNAVESEVDANGNMRTQFGTAALEVSVSGGGLTDLDVTMSNVSAVANGVEGLGGDIDLEAGADITIEAGANLTLEGTATASLLSDALTTIDAAAIQIGSLTGTRPAVPTVRGVELTAALTALCTEAATAFAALAAVEAGLPPKGTQYAALAAAFGALAVALPLTVSTKTLIE